MFIQAKHKHDSEAHRKEADKLLKLANKDPFGTFWEDPAKLKIAPHASAMFFDPSKKRTSSDDFDSASTMSAFISANRDRAALCVNTTPPPPRLLLLSVCSPVSA
jgi:hypothetical protein